MTALAKERTIPAFPLGQPVDGRPRYGMTPPQARLYRYLVENRPHDRVWKFDFRAAAQAIGSTLGSTQWLMVELIDRGWLEAIPGQVYSKYRFVHPVMRFKAPY